MNTLGQQQNDISSLSPLDLEQYERIFNIFTDTTNTKEFYFYNILRKIVIPDNIDSGITSFYNVSSPLAFTTISYNIYKDIRMWWLIYLLNKDTIGDNIFVVPAGTQLKYIQTPYLSTVFNQITNLIIFNGRHF